MENHFINQYSGVFTLEELVNGCYPFNDLISTAMGGTEEQMTAEEFYFKRLYHTTSYGLSGNVLSLTFDNGEMGYFVPKRSEATDDRDIACDSSLCEYLMIIAYAGSPCGMGMHCRVMTSHCRVLVSAGELAQHKFVLTLNHRDYVNT